MSDKVLIANYNGIQEYMHIDPMKPDDLIIETVQDCAPILEYTKELREGPVGKEWRHVACIPNYFIDKASKEGWLHDDAKWHAFLNDPDNKMFRTWPGRIGKSGQI
jgi:hypothetical protein